MKTFKTEFHPTAKQQEYIRKACGIRRWTWNWAVAEFFAAAKNDKFPSSFDLQKKLNGIVSSDPSYSWLTEINSMARGSALEDFGLSIKAYAKARQRAKRNVEKLPVDKYKPSFKKKGKCTESFRLFRKSGTEWKVHSAHDFSVVTVRGMPRMHIHPLESVEFLMSADIKTATFSMKGGRFFISITYEKTNQRKLSCGTGKVGIDLGIHQPLALFDGSQEFMIDIPATLKRAEEKTERCNQRLARSLKGSRRHNKLLVQLERAYMHESNVKKDFREKLTTELVRTYGQLNVDNFDFQVYDYEDVNRQLYRVGAYLFKLRLEEKAQESGCTLVIIPKYTPTTQTCSRCGAKHYMSLKDRIYSCPSCGLVLDRDINSAHNAYNYC